MARVSPKGQDLKFLIRYIFSILLGIAILTVLAVGTWSVRHLFLLLFPKLSGFERVMLEVVALSFYVLGVLLALGFVLKKIWGIIRDLWRYFNR